MSSLLTLIVLVITFTKFGAWESRKVANRWSCGQLKTENIPGIFFFSFSVSVSVRVYLTKTPLMRDRFGSPVPRQLAHSPHPRINLVLTPLFPPTFGRHCPSLYLQPPSSQSRLYRVTHLRTNDRQESADTRPVVLKVARTLIPPVTGCPVDHNHYQ